MKAVGHQQPLPIEDERSLLDCDVPKPEPGPRDIRVAIKAVSVNPIDTKVRKRATPPAGEYKILGYDAAGIVDTVGSEVTLFQPGDEVFYAGSLVRQGTNAEFHVVDERIVGRKPRTLSFAEAAALPLTSITAWELMFDRMGIAPGKADNRTLLIVENDEGFASFLREAAREKGFRTRVASRGAIAVAMAHDHPPDAITLDINLLYMDGWRVLERLKSHPASSGCGWGCRLPWTTSTCGCCATRTNRQMAGP